MLDRLLGRAALKERIAELEEDNERLRAQLEAEEERRAEAQHARQEAERRVNRLEDRIAELEDRAERAESEEKRPEEFRARVDLRRERLAEVLARVESLRTAPEGTLTAMIGDEVSDTVRTAVGERAPLVERAAPCLVVTDDERLLSVALAPPAPPEPFATWDDRPRLEERWFRPVGSFALALVRSDLFAYGAYEGADRVGFEGLTADVKSDHSKGGFSQARFERRRDAQIAEHLERCEAVIEERAPDRLYLLGERTALDALDLDVETADEVAVDATGDPEPALEEAFREFWTTRLALL
jgi:peptide subunit release factor 1 (eRF1)